MYTAEEQAEHRKRWVEALRSGKYEQGKFRLHRGGKFCCLGVACDISGLGEWIEEFDNLPDIFDEKEPVTLYGYSINGFAETNELPDEVMEWLGVDAGMVDIDDPDKVYLVTLNDEGFDFNEIADVIESGKVELSQYD